MNARPSHAPVPLPLGKVALMRAEPCTVSFYRYLYAAVGERWLWFERRIWDDETLRRHLARPEIEVFVLHVGGSPAGYFELDRSKPGDVELAYFGLVSEFIGRGYGAYLLQAAVDNGWGAGTAKRLWVHTCTYDHPRALGAYQRAGFAVYKRVPVTFEDPRLSGALPRDLEHPLLPKLPPV
jgi:GNAT superfamily N-acetyltransferase